MCVRLRSKRFYARARRHENECYGAVVDPTPGSAAVAYLVVDGPRERLVCRSAPEAPEQVLASDTCSGSSDEARTGPSAPRARVITRASSRRMVRSVCIGVHLWFLSSPLPFVAFVSSW